MMSIHQMDRDA